MNCQSRPGRERDVPGHLFVLVDAEFLAQLLAHLFAELALIGVGHLELPKLLADLVLRFLRLLEPSA